MSINPLNIISLLQKYFAKYNNESAISAIERALAKNFAQTIDRANINNDEIEIIEDLVFDENADYVEKEGDSDDLSDLDEDPDEDPAEESESPFGSEIKWIKFFPISREKTPRRDIILYSDKKKALQFYRSAAKGHRSLSSMRAQFRFIQTESDLKMMRRFEVSLKSREEALKQIDESVSAKFTDKFEKNLSLSDLILRKWALEANNSLGQNKINGFKASKNWLTKFKKRHRIVSRKITKFISKKHFINLEKVKHEAAEFIEHVRQLAMEEDLSGRDIINADQSGFELELHSRRTLAPIGTKLVECVVQSVASTTHSYTIMPMVTASGLLLSPLFVVIAERQGRFPQKGIFQAKNVYSVPNTSHVMTKKLMIEWVNEVLYPALRPA